MNPVGIYYAYWTHNWDADFLPFISRAKGLGFDVLELNSGTVTNMPDAERDRLKAEAQHCGVELTFCIGLTKEYDIACDSEAVRRKGIDFLQRQARMLRYMGSRELGGIIYGAWPGRLPAGDDRRAWLDRSVAAMQEVVKVVEDCGVTFNVEVVNRFEQFLMNTAAEAVEYVERVGSDRCKVLLDTFHMNIEEDSFREAIRTAGPRLGHVHLGETNRRAPGRGRIPWDEVFAALKEIGYGGSIVMEPFLMPGGEVGRDISVFRDLKGNLDLDAEARRACAFVKGKLA
jgi:D-psicose/D-tagatose/L-ribulose 3-epimerase